MAGFGLTYATPRTDIDGRFTLGPLVPGDRYNACISADGYQPAGTGYVTAVKGTTHDFGRIVLARVDGIVRGRVADAAGRPLAGVRVVNGGDAPQPLRTTTGADGQFELKGLSAKVVHVVAFHDGYRPARAAADTDKPDAVTLTLRRRGEPDPTPPPEGIDDATVRRAARQVLEKLREWPDARKSPADKKVIELMARLDPAQARRWADKLEAEEPSIDKLVETDLDEALAQLAGRDAEAACKELKRLAEQYRDTDRAKALRLAEELAVGARTVDPRYRLFRLGGAGRLLARLGKADAGRKLVEEAAAQAEKLPAAGWEGYLRGHVASRLAPFDLPRAKRLIEPVSVKTERDRYAAMCANALAATDPKAAAELLRSIEKGFERGKYTPAVAYLMAPADPEAAARLAEECGEGSSYTARGLAWAALAVAPRDKPAARRLIDRAFRSVHDRTSEAKGWNFFGGWGEAAGTVALFALATDYPDRADLATHVFAERPTAQDVSTEVRAVEANVGLAVLLAPVDRAAARTLLDVAEPRRDVIGSGGGGVRQRTYLTAWALIDPPRAVPLLTGEIGKLNAAGKGLPEHCDLLDVLTVMTAPAADRPRAMARSLSIGWPTEEIE
jgi:hypothetical protein